MSYIPCQSIESIIFETKDCDFSNRHEWGLVWRWTSAQFHTTHGLKSNSSHSCFFSYLKQKLRKCWGQSCTPPAADRFGLVQWFSPDSCLSPGLHGAQVGVSVTRPWRAWHTWVASRSMNSISTCMSSVSCTNLKPAVVKIGLLDGRSLFVDSVYETPWLNPAVVPLIENKCILLHCCKWNQNSFKRIDLKIPFSQN